MKKIIISLVSGVLYTSLITGYATAQKATDIAFADAKFVNTTSPAAGDKTVSNASTSVDKTAIKEMKANLKAAKAEIRITSHFNKNFKNVSDLNWSSEEKVTVGTFKMDEKSGRIVYDKKGNWLYTIINYQEDQMPQNIRSQVNAVYSGFTITLVQEISQGDITLFKVHLEDCKSLKQILVYNEEITVYEEFTKSK